MLFLIVASFVASSVEEDIFAKDGVGIALTQHPETIRPNETIFFNWNITHKPLSTGEYCFEIKDPNEMVIHEQRITIPSDEEFDAGINITPDEVFDGGEWRIAEERTAKYTATLTFPCEDPGPIRATSTTFFKVPETLLIIQKFNDTNQNGRIDGRDERLQRWEFKVTDPDGNTKTYSTEPPMGEKRIVVPEEYAGKSYTIEETLPPGWKPILPKKQTVRVSKGETTTVQFLNEISDTILIIQKFNDTNRNSRLDGNDERLRGWEFKVTDPDGNTKTIRGEIILEVPPEYAGKEYTVEEILQPGWKSILPSKQTVNVPAGETTTVQFLNAETLLLIEKFGDSNRNSKIDGSDDRLQGWKFNVTDPDGNTKAYYSNSKGEITIKVPGEYAGRDYIIEETLPPMPPKWESVLPIKQPVHVKVPLGEITPVQFLNRIRNTTLIIQKFSDINRNGEVDSEDERLPDWNFNVTDPDERTTSHPTDDNGEIIIDVPPKYIDKEYTIEETLLPDWEPVLPIEQPVHVKVPLGETETVQFLNKKNDTLLIIRKFSDSNQNKEVDSEDERLQGWEFKVTDPAGKTTTHITNDIGEIVINVLREYEVKDYIVKETLKPEWVAVLPIKQPVHVNVPNGKTTTVNFLNSGNGDLSIIKFYDLNQNRVQDPEEQGLAWNFTITFPDGSVKRVTTAVNGVYRLRNIPVGAYTIREESRGCRWTSSTDMTQKVDVPAGKEAIALFGNYIAECCILPGCVWNNRDKNIEVCKSVDPCSVVLGNEEWVTVYLRVCVDREHILNGTKVENISVIDTLHSQFTVVEGRFSKEPKNDPRKNLDGTTTITWDIPDLCCEEWNVSFNVTATFALPIDVTEYERVASKVKYDDPETKDVKELAIPEGKLLFVLPTPTQTLSPTPEPPGFEALLAIAGLLAVAYMMWRRKR